MYTWLQERKTSALYLALLTCKLWHSPVHTVMVAVEDQGGFDSIIPGVYYWVSEMSPHTSDVNRDLGGKLESAVALSM